MAQDISGVDEGLVSVSLQMRRMSAIRDRVVQLKRTEDNLESSELYPRRPFMQPSQEVLLSHGRRRTDLQQDLVPSGRRPVRVWPGCHRSRSTSVTVRDGAAAAWSEFRMRSRTDADPPLARRAGGGRGTSLPPSLGVSREITIPSLSSAPPLRRSHFSRSAPSPSAAR